MSEWSRRSRRSRRSNIFLLEAPGADKDTGGAVTYMHSLQQPLTRRVPHPRAPLHKPTVAVRVSVVQRSNVGEVKTRPGSGSGSSTTAVSAFPVSEWKCPGVDSRGALSHPPDQRRTVCVFVTYVWRIMGTFCPGRRLEQRKTAPLTSLPVESRSSTVKVRPSAQLRNSNRGIVPANETPGPEGDVEVCGLPRGAFVPARASSL